MSAGPVLIGLPGLELGAEDLERLGHPDVGGVVLFKRNFHDLDQLLALVEGIRGATDPRPLICIDQEGGRVQRLEGAGFTRLPPLGVLGRLHADDPVKALDMAYRHGRVMATEMLACGIDMSFAPVLDLDRGSRVIGDRAFDADPGVIALLAKSYLAGMHDAGMRSTGKHFPGHGSVVADSHVDDVLDPRTLAEIQANDMAPFRQLMPQLDALMIAHVVYPEVDERPAGYSRTWLRDILRGELGYTGVVVSDDLGMHAAKAIGGVRERAAACLEAGCDLVLVCHPDDVDELQAAAPLARDSARPAIERLYGTPTVDRHELAEVVREGIREWGYWRQSLEQLGESWA